MELWRLWVLRGPNRWAVHPVLEASVDLAVESESARKQIECLLSRLPSPLPNIVDDDGMPQILANLILHLQVLAGNAVAFAEVRRTARPRRYRIAVEYQEEPVGLACLRMAVEMFRAVGEDRPFDVDRELARLRELADDQILGPSTRAIVEAARARGIPIDHLNPEDGRYLQLGHGARQRRSLATETDAVSAVARSISTDKHLTKLLLREAGVPVPKGRPVQDAEDAWTTACEIGLPVAVKPRDRDLAQGVGLNLRSREQVEAAYRSAREKSSEIVVERFAAGVEHRLLVVEDRVVAAARIDPPHVVGDGVSRVIELVEAVNRDPRRGDAYPSPLRRIKLDAVARQALAAQDCTLDSIPSKGVRVLLRRDPPHVENGGCLSDCTDRVHAKVAACAVAAAQALRIRVAGVDMVVEDIGRPLEEQGGVVVEINTGPGMGLHTAPWVVNPRPVGEAIVASMFPLGSDGRIPIVAVTGARARAAARCLAALLTDRGFRVGRANGDSVCVAGRKIVLEAATGHDKARALLRNNLVDAVVLEISARELLREGLSCDRCDVALLTGASESSDNNQTLGGGDDIDAEEWAEASRALIRAVGVEGRIVLNADAPPSWFPATEITPSQRLIWVSHNGCHPRLSDHRALGGTVVFLSGDSLVLARGDEEQRLAFGGHPVEKDPCEQLALLAALAGATVLNLCGDEAPAPAAPPQPALQAALSVA